MEPKEDKWPGFGQLVPFSGKFGSDGEMQRWRELRSHCHISGTSYRPESSCCKNFVVVPVAKSLYFSSFYSLSKLGLPAFWGFWCSFLPTINSLLQPQATFVIQVNKLDKYKVPLRSFCFPWVISFHQTSTCISTLSTTTIRRGEAELWCKKPSYVHKEGFSDGKMNLLFDFCCWFIVDQRGVFPRFSESRR